MMLRRTLSTLSGAAVLLIAELWMWSFLSWTGQSAVAEAGASAALITISCFAAAGFVAGAIAKPRDPVPLIGIEVLGLGSVLLSLAIGAVETGAKEISRNAALGMAGLVLMATVYATVQRIRLVSA
jgi:hypothetical protein